MNNIKGKHSNLENNNIELEKGAHNPNANEGVLSWRDFIQPGK